MSGLGFGQRAAMMAALGLTLGAGCRDSKVAVSDEGGRDGANTPVAATRSGPGTRDGHWQGTDARSTWHAILSGPHVVQLDEVALSTDSSRAMRQIQLDTTGRLTAVREERLLVVRGQAVVPDTVRTVIALAWQGDSLTQRDKQVNGTPRPLQPYELDNLRRHVDELLVLVRTGTTTP
ncbi:MAG: hypothetical protein WCK74_04165 [Gemmatimonadaceae bacterium]